MKKWLEERLLKMRDSEWRKKRGKENRRNDIESGDKN